MKINEIKFAIDYMEENMPKWEYESDLYCSSASHGSRNLVCQDPEGYVYKTSIEALKRQIPEKPVYREDINAYFCPDDCGAIVGYCKHERDVISNRDEYCHLCGKKIDWSEVTE